MKHCMKSVDDQRLLLGIPVSNVHLFFFIKQVNGRASERPFCFLLFTLLNGLMVIGARGGAKLTEVISKQKHSCAWNGDNIINIDCINKVNLFSDHNENSQDTY